ncbi:MAG TPA: SOS response-associated peptidase [Anaerolineales bacterium]|nr:SOS response-associated peptidase [Anaerolineales bacterium]
MCGRFTLTVDPDELKTAFPWAAIPNEITPRFNIAPSQPVAVVANNSNPRLDFFTWGLIPSWAKDPTIGSRLINARSETLAEKPSFRTAFRRRRCLVLADGFFEWKSIPGSKSKIPYYIQLKDRNPFAFAGLWDIWRSPDGSEIYSCAIITTTPNEFMQAIHARMPAILQNNDYAQWLDSREADPVALSHLICPYPAEEMIAHPVSSLVNSPQNDSPACIQPAE